MACAAPHATGHQVVAAAAAAPSQYYLLPLFLVEALRQAQRGVSPIHRHTPAAVSGLVVKHPQLPTDRELGRMGGSQQLEDCEYALCA